MRIHQISELLHSFFCNEMNQLVSSSFISGFWGSSSTANNQQIHNYQIIRLIGEGYEAE